MRRDVRTIGGAHSGAVSSPLSSRITNQLQDAVSRISSGSIVAVTAPQFIGRGNAWVVTLSTGQRLFIKRIARASSSSSQARRAISFSVHASNHPLHAPVSPLLLNRAHVEHDLVFEFCAGKNFRVHYADIAASREWMSEKLGASLAKLHSGPTSDLPEAGTAQPEPAHFREGLPLHKHVGLTLAELKIWGQLQEDQTFIDALEALRQAERSCSSVPIHGDLRMDQIHVKEGEVCLLDWEEFGAGDPARDVGSIIGDWLHHGIREALSSLASPGPHSTSSQDISEILAAAIAEQAPRIATLWGAYVEHSSTRETALNQRIASYAGWHLIERTLVNAATVARLPGVDAALAGIGRRLLLEPMRFSRGIGLHPCGETPQETP